jgi:hypothetical protein
LVDIFLVAQHIESGIYRVVAEHLGSNLNDLNNDLFVEFFFEFAIIIEKFPY